ncbi:hypothetical protein L3X38_013518 [Prunus dulcis]|uniref:Large ribosomal subunit protein uL11 C-terminal domain-containing protein n=1 Tax=Prunus dulcis TaxID=3755 RepID=A0AAD4WM23_PRUDU|nr:hypothetical protein L3X38_013518 [Prunus dulcis]
MQLGYNGKKYGSRWLTLSERSDPASVVVDVRAAKPCPPEGDSYPKTRAGEYPDVPVVVTLNNTYEFMVKSPSVNWYLRKATSLDSGSSRLKHVVASELSLRHVYEIAKVNQSDPYFQYMPALESICKPLLSRIIE